MTYSPFKKKKLGLTGETRATAGCHRWAWGRGKSCHSAIMSLTWLGRPLPSSSMVQNQTILCMMGAAGAAVQNQHHRA